MSDESTTQVVQETSAPIQGVPDEVPNQTPEAPETEKPKKGGDFLAPKFAALTRKEKQIREMERAVKAQQAEIERQRSEWESKSKSTQESESQLLAKLKKNPLKALSELGVTYDQLMEMQLNEQNPTPQMQIEQMRAELEAKMEEKYGKLAETLKQKEEREAKERYEAAVTGYKSELSDFVQKNADTYELIVANNATDLMFEVAENYYQQSVKDYEAGLIESPRVPSHEEIAQAVESHLEEEAKKILSLKKFQTAKKVEAKSEAKTSQTAPTLSNTLAAEVPKNGSKLLSDEQSKAEAAKLLRWTED